MTINNLKMMTKTELAEILNVSLRTLQRWINLGRIPEPVKIGKSLRWLRSKIQKWIDEGCPNQNGGK